MTWTATTFKARFEEFTPQSDTLVETVLAEAALECDERIFGESLDHAVGLLAAHKLAVSPFGQSARLVAKDGSTTYEREFQKLSRKKAGGPWTTGIRADGSVL